MTVSYAWVGSAGATHGSIRFFTGATRRVAGTGCFRLRYLQPGRKMIALAHFIIIESAVLAQLGAFDDAG